MQDGGLMVSLDVQLGAAERQRLPGCFCIRNSQRRFSVCCCWVRGRLPTAPLPVPHFPMNQWERAVCVCVLGDVIATHTTHIQFQNKSHLCGCSLELRPAESSVTRRDSAVCLTLCDTGNGEQPVSWWSRDSLKLLICCLFF